MVNPGSRTELVIKLLDPLRYQLFLLTNGGNQKTPLDYSSKSRHSGGQEKVFFVRNVRCLVNHNWKHSGLFNFRNSAMVLSKLSLLSRDFFRWNPNSSSGFQTLSINQNFSASVNEDITRNTLPISISEQSSFRQIQIPLKVAAPWHVTQIDWFTTSALNRNSQWKETLTGAQLCSANEREFRLVHKKQ